MDFISDRKIFIYAGREKKKKSRVNTRPRHEEKEINNFYSTLDNGKWKKSKGNHHHYHHHHGEN